MTAGLERLRGRRLEAEREYRAAEEEAAELEARAGDSLAEAGALLVPARDHWSPPAELVAHFQEADRLVERLADIDRKLGEKSYRPQQRQLLEDRERASARLRWVLIQVARAAGDEVVLRIGQLQPAYEDAGRCQAEAGRLRAEAVSLRAEVARIEREIAAAIPPR